MALQTRQPQTEVSGSTPSLGPLTGLQAWAATIPEDRSHSHAGHLCRSDPQRRRTARLMPPGGAISNMRDRQRTMKSGRVVARALTEQVLASLILRV